MDKRRLWRWLFTALSTVGFVVMALNIERLTEFLGLDEALIGVVTRSPEWLSGVWALVASDVALIIAIAIVAYTAGLWTETIARRIAIGRNRPFDRTAFSEECKTLASVIRANAEYFGSGRGHATMILVDLWDAEGVFRTKLGVIVDLVPRDRDSAFEMAKFLDDVSAAIAEGDIGQVRDLAMGFKASVRQRSETLT